MASERIGVVVGLRAEARIARELGWDVAVGGGDATGAADAAARLIARGATALVSFGLAGGLDPALPAGTLLVPRGVRVAGSVLTCDLALAARLGGMTQHLLLGGEAIVANAADKQRLWRESGAHAIDLESAAVAQAARARGLPFAILRAVCDPATTSLPPAALAALDQHGAIGPWRVLASLLRAPGQIPALLTLARDAATARRALAQRARQLGAQPRR